MKVNKFILIKKISKDDNFDIYNKMVRDKKAKIMWLCSYLKDKENLKNLLERIDEKKYKLRISKSFFRSKKFIFYNHPEMLM
jgi:hypothetical protein